MEPVPGYKAANWSKGYGDFVMKPDLSTLRHVPWLEKTALVLCDILDHHTHEGSAAFAARHPASEQVARLKERGWLAYFASELEFYLFDESYDSARAKHWQNLATASSYTERLHDPADHQGRGVMRAIRNGLEAAGIPVENSKGDWGRARKRSTSATPRRSKWPTAMSS